ncbi:MAG: hypothetical protein ACFFDN_29040 [Candidatus Hodarchaeota archaeon]
MVDSKTREERDDQEKFYLPDFFWKEFPNLSKFLYENLIKDSYKKERRPMKD